MQVQRREALGPPCGEPWAWAPSLFLCRSCARPSRWQTQGTGSRLSRVVSATRAISSCRGGCPCSLVPTCHMDGHLLCPGWEGSGLLFMTVLGTSTWNIRL